MKSVNSLSLTTKQTQSLKEIQSRLSGKFEIENFILYGSIARGEGDEESDIDLLVLTKLPFTRFERHKITDMVFEINLHYGTNISTLVIDHDSWKTGAVSVLPIHDCILKEGIRL